VGLSLSDIREILDLYSAEDGGAAQAAKSLRKFRDQVVALEARREDIDHALEILRDGCARLEAQLAQTRPDLLPQAADYDQVLRARLDGVHEFAK
jgi:DNA-binding transcriptional MerR regulator